MALHRPRGMPSEVTATAREPFVFAYLEPGQRDAVLYDLAVSFLHQAEPKRVPLAGLLALGGTLAAGLVLARRLR